MDDFAALGVVVTGQDGKEPEAAIEDDTFHVFDTNWQSMEVFLALGTQWRFAGGLSGMNRTGLDYMSLDVVMRRMKAKRGVFHDVRVMEAAALELFAEAAENG